MSAYEPPTAVYPIFDSLAFQIPNSASLTLAEGDLRYLARQNIATSIASLTSFAGSIDVPSVTTSSTVNFTSTELNSNINIGTNNLLIPFSAKGNIAIGNAVMDDAGLLAGATNNTGIGVGVLQNLTNGDRNVAIGYLVASGVTTGSDNVIMGNTTGSTLTTGTNNVVLGNAANVPAAAANGVAIGATAVAGTTNNISIGAGAGSVSQGIHSIAIGTSSGNTSTGNNAIAIGRQAGTNQGGSAISIGYLAANTGQLANGIAIGQGAGTLGQGISGIAIGTNAAAGITSLQGANAIAIGNSAGYNSQVAGSIILNASGSALDATTNVSTYINPIRNAGSIDPISNYQPLYHNTSTKELVSVSLSTSTKTNGTLANTAMTTTTFYNYLTAGLTIPVGTFIVQFSINFTTTAVAGLLQTFKAGLSTAVGAFTGGTGGLTMISQYSYPALTGTLIGNYTLVFQNTVAQTYYLPVQITFATIVPTTDALNSFITFTRIA